MKWKLNLNNVNDSEHYIEHCFFFKNNNQIKRDINGSRINQNIGQGCESSV